MFTWHRCTFLKAACLAAAVLLCGHVAFGQTASEKPNVLFIAVDDLNDWVGYLGGHPQAKTPHIDALAKEAVTFEHAYCPAPICGPSRTALMYGMAPHKSGSYGHANVYDPKNVFPESRLPLNQVFQNNGYYTAGCGKIFHYGEKRGWDAYQHIFKDIAHGKIKRAGSLKYGIQETNDDGETSDGQLTDWAIKQLQRSHEKPFFIALGLRKPHLPWVAPRKYFEQYDLEAIQIPEVPADDLADLPEAARVFAHSIVGFVKLDDHKAIIDVPGAWQELVHAYLATSSFADANVGRLLAALEDSPHRDNTIVVLWGDHGWHLGEKEHWKKMTLWERGTRTPFIIRIPGGEARRVEAPVSLQDIFPTLVDLCGLEVAQELDGHSVRPLLEGSAATWDKPVIMSHGPGNFAIRKGTWRLIRYADGSEELYDLENDPKEWTNLAKHSEHQATAEALRTHVPQSWRYVMGPRFEAFSDCFAKPAQPGRTHGLIGLRPLPRDEGDHKRTHGGSWAGTPTYAEQKGNYPFVAEHLDTVMGWPGGDFKTKQVFFEYYWGLSDERDDLTPKRNGLIRVIRNWEQRGAEVGRILIAREYDLAINRGHDEAKPGPFKEDTRILYEQDVDNIRAMFKQAHDQGLLKKDHYQLIQMVQHPSFFADDERVKPIIDKMEGVCLEVHQFGRHWPLDTGWVKPELVVRGAKWTLDQGKDYVFYFGPIVWKSEYYHPFVERDWIRRYWEEGLPKRHPKMHYYLNLFPHAHGRGRPVGPETDPHSVLGFTKWLIHEVKGIPESAHE